MSDERIDIEVKASADFDEVKSLEKTLDEVISKSQIDIGVSADSTEIDDAQQKLDEMDGTVVSDSIEMDSESVNDAQEKLDNIDGTEVQSSVSMDTGDLDKAMEKMDDFSSKVEESSSSTEKSISASSSMYLAGQISNLGNSAEGMADGMNEAKITLGQLATVTGVAEPEMESLVTSISNVTFPNEEAMLYIKNLQQMGVDSKNFGQSATEINKIHDAFGLTAGMTNSMATELSVLGVDMNNVSSSFNALAYANANTKGGMDNFYTFLKKYDAQLHDLGYNVDQASIIISGATQKFGGGRAALSGLSTALKEADGDSRKLEEALGLQSGSLDKASSITGKYEGQLLQLAEEEEEHKTILDQMGAVWEDIALRCGGAIEGIAGFAGVLGRLGSMGMTVMGLKNLVETFQGLNTKNLSKSTSGISKFGTTLKTSIGNSTLGSTIKSLLKMETETAVIKGEVSAIDKTAKSTITTGGMKTQAKSIHTLTMDATKVGIAGEEGYVAGATEEAGAGGLQAVATGMWALIPAIVQIAVVVAIIIAIIGALVAEVVLIVKGIQLLINAMDFGGIDFSKTIKGLKQLGSAVMEIGKIMLGMTFTALVTGVYKFLTLGGLVNPIQSAKEDIKNTIKAINEIGGYGTVDDNVVKTLENISTGVNALGEVIGSMADTSWKVIMGNLMTLGGMLGDFQSLMNDAKQDIQNAIKVINELELDSINKDTIDKLKNVSDALSSFGDAMSGLGDIQWTETMNNLNPFTDIPQALESAKGDLIQASQSLKEYDGLEAPSEDVGKKIKSVSDTLASVSEALNKIGDIGWTEGMNWLNPLVDLSGNLASAKADIWFASQKLSELNDMPSIPTTVTEKLKTLGSTLATSVNTFKALENMDSTVFDMNFLRDISNSMNTAKTDIVKVSSIMKSLGEEISTIPEGLGGQLQRVTWVANGVVNAIRSLNVLGGMEIDTATISSKIQNAQDVIIQASAKFNTISTETESIDSEVGTKVQTVTEIAKNVVNAINTLIGLPVVPEDIGLRIDQAINSVKTTIDKLNTLSNSTVDGNISSILSAVTNTLNTLQTTLSSMGSGIQSSSVGIGTGIVNGIKSGMSNLTSTVTGIVNTSTSASASQGWTGGSRIGTSIMGGFKSAFNLHTTMTTELGYTLTAIQTAVVKYKGAGEQLGRSVVQGFQLGINTGSPGDVYHSMEDELNYVKYLIPSYNSTMRDMSADLGQNVVSGFSQNSSMEIPTVNGQQSYSNINTSSSPIININVDGNINDENTMNTLVEKLTRAITWSNAMGNRSV